jgi:putative flippase GtrA
MNSAFFRFVVTGVLSNVILFFVLALLLWLSIDYRIAVSITYVLGMIWSYLQNRLWSWQSRAPVFASVMRFLSVYAGIYVAHLGLVTIFVEWVGLMPLVAALISVAVLVTPIFIFFDRFIFRAPK